MAGHVARYLAGIQADDILYNSLPLYHSSAGMLALAPCYLYGLTVVIRQKFSVSSFWKDCVKYKCTVSLGEENLFVCLCSNMGALKLTPVVFVQLHLSIGRMYHCNRVSQYRCGLLTPSLVSFGGGHDCISGYHEAWHNNGDERKIFR